MYNKLSPFELRRINANLRTKLEKQDIEIQSLKRILVIKDQMIESQESENKKAQEMLHKSNTDLNLIKTSHSTLEKEFNKLNKDHEELESEKQRLTKILNHYYNKTQDLKKIDYSQLQMDLNQKKIDFDACSSENAKLRSDLATTQRLLRENTTNTMEIQEKYQQLESKLEKMKKKIKKKDSELQKNEKIINSMTEEKGKLTQLEIQLKFFKQKEKQAAKKFDSFSKTVLSGLSDFHNVLKTEQVIDVELEMETHQNSMKAEDKPKPMEI